MEGAAKGERDMEGETEGLNTRRSGRSEANKSREQRVRVSKGAGNQE